MRELHARVHTRPFSNPSKFAGTALSFVGSAQAPARLDTTMVLIESVGFGVRERDLFLYFRDLRDGSDWSGWWVTPDFKGNNDYILQAQNDCEDPSEVGVGDWRWPRTPSNRTPKAQACA